MKQIRTPIGLMPFPSAPRKKPIIGSIIGGVLGLAGSAMASSQQAGYTKEQQKLQSKLNREEMAYSQGLQNAQQEWLMNTQYGKMASGMKNAGFNPATANGTSIGGAPSAGHPSTGGTGPSAGMPNVDLVGAAATGLQMEQSQKRLENETKVADAQAESLSAQAERDRKQAGLTQKDIDSYGDRLAADLANKGAQTNLYGAQSAEAKENAALLRKKGNEIQENIKLIQQRVNESKANEKFTRTQERQYKRVVDAQVRQAFANAHWFDTQASNMVQEAIFKWSLMSSEADAKDAERLMTDAMRRLVEKYGDAEKVSGIVSQVIRSIGDTAMDFLITSKLTGVTKGAKIAGSGVAAAKKHLLK